MASGARPSSNQRSSVSSAVGEGDVFPVITQVYHRGGNQSSPEQHHGNISPPELTFVSLS